MMQLWDAISGSPCSGKHLGAVRRRGSEDWLESLGGELYVGKVKKPLRTPGRTCSVCGARPNS